MGELLKNNGEFFVNNAETENENNVHICACCGRIIEEGEVSHTITVRANTNYYDNLTNDIEVCDDCIDNYTIISSTGIHYTEDDNEDTVFYSEYEDQYIDSFNISDRYNHSLPYVFCEDCGNLVPQHYTTYAEGNTVCNNCIENYCYCDECGEYFYSEHLNYTDDDRYLCNDCYEEYLEDNCLEEYHDSHGRYLDFKRTEKEIENKNPLFLGHEWEVDKGYDRNDTVASLKNLSNNLYFYEHDGSLDDGFEMVSQPATLNYILENYIPTMEQMREVLMYNDFKSHDAGTCGFHIHVNKDYFIKPDSIQYHEREKDIELACAKFILIFQLHWENMLRFSRRTVSQTNRWTAKYDEVDNENTIRYKYQKARDILKGNVGRYHAVNITNSNTIEIRLWRGTLNIETIIATFKFTARLAELVKNNSVYKLCKMSFDDLLGDDEDILKYWQRVKDRDID